MLGPVILLYNWTVMVSVVRYICTVNPGATLASVEVALTILKLTGTDGQAGGQTGRRGQVSIGMHAHPKTPRPGYDCSSLAFVQQHKIKRAIAESTILTMNWTQILIESINRPDAMFEEQLKRCKGKLMVLLHSYYIKGNIATIGPEKRLIL